MSDLCTKVYVDKEGKEYRALPEDPSGIVARVFKFSNGEQRTLTPKEMPKNVRHGAELYGLGAVGAATLNNAKGDVTKAVELFDRRMEQMLNGVWSEASVGGGGGRDSAIVAAALAYAEEQGREVDPSKLRDYFTAADIEGEDEAATKARSEARTERKKKWRKVAAVEAHYQRIRAERQREAAERAAGAVAGAEPTDDPFAAIAG